MADSNSNMQLGKKEVDKEFPLTSLSIKNKVTVFVLSAIIFLAGLTAYQSMPSETFPEIVTPEIYVGTPYPGNSPLDIEKLVTRPLEKEINGISGIDEITSTSVQGYSTIQVKFNFDVEPSEALRKVKDKVDIAKADPEFPDDLPAEPNVFEMNFSELVPIMNINLSGDFSSEQLKEYAEFLEEEIEDLTEISKAEIRGIDEKELRIHMNQPKMESLEISFSDVGNAIQRENISIAGGDLKVGDIRRNVRVIGEFKSAEEVGNIIVQSPGGQSVYLKDIAEVKFTEKEKESYARQYSQPVVMVDVMKRAGENLIIVSDKIRNIIDDAEENYFPSNLEISITNDQSDQTRTQLSELENSIIFGVILVTLVLMFFLGLRNALFVGIAIPLSMLLSFFILNALGVTLNTIVLFSLVLALGMLVDNGIVVVENIYRQMAEGKPSNLAAKQGTGEVALPIIASTATTIAAFLPLAFWPGIFGEFMKYLPITLITVLGSSLLVALVINPVFTSVYMKVEEDEPNPKKLRRWSIILLISGILFDVLSYVLGWTYAIGNLLILAGVLIPFFFFGIGPAIGWFQKKLIPWLEKIYNDTLHYALKGRNVYLFFFGSIMALVISVALVGAFPPKVLFFPENQPNLVYVYIDLPIGTDIERTNEVTREIEQEVLNTIDKYEVTERVNGKDSTYNYMVESVIAQVGEGTSDPNQGPSMAQTPNKAKVTVAMVEFQERRGVASEQVLREIRAAVSDYPGAQISVDKNQEGPPAGPPINIEISGDNYSQLMNVAENMKSFIQDKQIEGIEELKLDVDLGKPELPIKVDRDKARRLGISSYAIGDALRTALYGKEISTFKLGEDDYPINLRLMDKYRYDLEALMSQRITYRDMNSGQIRQVPINAVAEYKRSSTFSAVKRIDLDRVITISSNVLSGYNPTETVNNIKASLEDFETPTGVSYQFTGQQEEQAQELDFLSSALMIAVFLVFLIMVSQFNSAIKPFIIMTSVVLSLIGVFLGLVIFRQDFVIMMTMIGLISLAGIVVNNAIVLVDYIQLLMDRKRRAEGLEEGERLTMAQIVECVAEGGKVRLRPVLLTAITTVLGLFPLAIGLNINFFTLISQFDPQIFVGGDNVVFWGPMAWTIIYGLTFATFLTLVVVPVMFLITERLRFWYLAKFRNENVRYK